MSLISALANLPEIVSFELGTSFIERLFEELPAVVVAATLSVISILSVLDSFAVSELKDLFFFTAAY